MEEHKKPEFTWQDWMNGLMFYLGIYLWAMVYYQ